jgi:hypothetical protein
MFPKFKIADCGLSASKTWLSKAIRFAGKLQTGHADRSHCLSWLEHRQIIEALVRVRIADESKYYDQDIEVYRLPLTETDRINFLKGIQSEAGDSYGWSKLPLHLLDSVASACINLLRKEKKPVFWFTAKLSITSYKDCSQLFVHSLHKYTTYRLKDEKQQIVKWQTVAPDRLQDLFKLEINNCKLLFKQNNKGEILFIDSEVINEN